MLEKVGLFDFCLPSHQISAVELVKDVIERDISKAQEKGFIISLKCLLIYVLGILFRANTTSSKIFKYFAYMVGLPYLFTTLGRFLFDLYKEFEEEEQLKVRLIHITVHWHLLILQSEIESHKKSNQSLGSELLFHSSVEINPDQMEEGMDESVNILELQVKCQKLFAQIIRSYSHMPR